MHGVYKNFIIQAMIDRCETSLYANTLGKGMNLNLLSCTYGLLVR